MQGAPRKKQYHLLFRDAPKIKKKLLRMLFWVTVIVF